MIPQNESFSGTYGYTAVLELLCTSTAAAVSPKRTEKRIIGFSRECVESRPRRELRESWLVQLDGLIHRFNVAFCTYLVAISLILGQ